MLYEATDVAIWIGEPNQHRLIRYYLHKFVREQRIVMVRWKNFMFFGRKELAPFLRDICEWEGGMKFRLK